MRYVKIALCLIISLIFTVPAAAVDDGLADVYFSADCEKKLVALTFDDGPHPRYTAEILDILKEHDIKATFFIIGKLAEEYPDLVRREVKEGHELASHTWSHPKPSAVSEKELCDELARTEELIFSLTGYRTCLFRPPEGKYSDSVLRVAAGLDYEVVLWTVDTMDWSHPSTEKIVNTVVENTHPGSIILCHDFIGRNSPTPEALRKFIPELKRNGYEFVTVSELIFYND